VVLSACETQVGTLSIGDDVVGLTRAFFFAGTPSVIASLWPVDDQSTSLLMERFYTHLRAGMGKAAALRQAQIEVKERYPNPYYWSAFVLSGDGGEVGDIQPTVTIVQGQEGRSSAQGLIPVHGLILAIRLLTVILLVRSVVIWQQRKSAQRK
jgi:hypothetical protein